MGKIQNILYKDGQRFFLRKETCLVYPTLTNFTQRKRKTYDANDLLVLSLVNIIAYTYSLGKKFYVHIQKQPHEMILSHAKLFNEKMREQPEKKEETCERLFQHLQLMI